MYKIYNGLISNQMLRSILNHKKYIARTTRGIFYINNIATFVLTRTEGQILINVFFC